jgi:hypothetical protein
MSDSDTKTAARDSAPAATHVEPPEIYVPACGVLCDIFWWARRNPAAEEAAALPEKIENP